MSTTTKRDWIEEVGGPVYRSVESLVAALECDYDRLAELREMRASAQASDAPEMDKEAFDGEAQTDLAELEEAAGECESREEADRASGATHYAIYCRHCRKMKSAECIT